MNFYSLLMLALGGSALPALNPINQINDYAQALLNLDPSNPYSKQFIQDAARENLTPSIKDFTQFFVGIHIFEGCLEDIKQSQVAQLKQQIVLYQFYLISNGNLASPLTDQIIPKTWSICNRGLGDFDQDLVYDLESQKLTIKISPGKLISNQLIMDKWRDMKMFPDNIQKLFQSAWIVMNPFGVVIPKLRGVLYEQP
jgi:hypothetical protein